jgi:DNA topoisomerase-1
MTELRDAFHCPECGLPMHLVSGAKFDTFVGCTGFPECRETRNVRADESGRYVMIPNERDREEALVQWLRQ